MNQKVILNTWDEDQHYGEVLYKRAIGEFPEMESSKAAARRLKPLIQTGDHLLDVGCGAGHYYTSFKREIGDAFNYTGMDQTKNYIELGKKAFANEQNVQFAEASIFDLPVADQSFDIVVCNNLFLHLPSIAKPLSELIRAAKRHVIVRTLIGDRSFYIKESGILGDEFNDQGEPKEYHNHNIYSRAYIDYLISGESRVASHNYEPDEDYDPKAIDKASEEHDGSADATRMLKGWQINGYILQPWAFLKIDLK